MANRKKSKKLTPIQAEYKRQRDRIRKFVSRAEARGYIFNEDAIPAKKRPTRKAIEELAYLTPDRLYARAYRLDVETGELVHGNRAREEERREAARKGAQTKKANQAAEAEFWGGEQPASGKQKNASAEVAQPQTQKPQPPDGGEIIFQNIIQQFLLKLADACEASTGGNARQQALNQARAQAKSLIESKVNEAVARLGKSGVGWLIQDNESQLGEYITVIAYASNEGLIVAAAYKIVEILDRDVTREEKETLNKLSEEFEDWDDI